MAARLGIERMVVVQPSPYVQMPPGPPPDPGTRQRILVENPVRLYGL